MSVIKNVIINFIVLNFYLLLLIEFGNGQIGSFSPYPSINNYRQYHSQDYGEEAPLEESTAASEYSQDGNDTQQGIPLDVLEKISQADNIRDVYNIIYKNEAAQFLDHSDEMERNAGITLPSAYCKLMDQVVPLNVSSSDPRDVFYPACITVKRCSGCCTPSELKSCQPVDNNILNVIVTKFTYHSGTNISRSKQIVLVEEHKKCQCQCKIKATDCNKYQEYNSRNCRCDCVNLEERTKCYANRVKIWVPQNCTCRCAETTECTTGTYFDERDCTCKVPTTRLYSERRKFIVKPIEIYPDNSTQYFTEG